MAHRSQRRDAPVEVHVPAWAAIDAEELSERSDLKGRSQRELTTSLDLGTDSSSSVGDGMPWAKALSECMTLRALTHQPPQTPI